MQKAILALFCIFAVISAIPVSKSGNLTLSRTTGGFYTVPAGLDIDATTGEAAQEVNVLVSLFSNKHFVGTNCAGFDVDISGRDVKPVDPVQADSVLFANNKYQGNQATANLAIDTAYWKAANNIVYGTNCPAINAGDTDFSGNGLGGSIGLGYGANSGPNYNGNTPSVSVTLAKNLQSGNLLFIRDEEKLKTLKSENKFTTTPAWQIYNFSAVALGKTVFNTPDTNNRIIFDLNTDSIAVPSFIWSQIFSAFDKTICNADLTTYQPTCKITGPLSQLPNLTITFADTTFTVPPQAYVINAASYNETLGGTVTLGLKSINSSVVNTDPRVHVSVTFNTSIIIGAPFFSYYYAVFTGDKDSTKNGNVELFTEAPVTPPGPGPAPSSSKWWLVLVILAVILVIVGIYWFVARRNKANKLQEEINNNLLRA